MNSQFDNISEKSWTITFLLCLVSFLGTCGLHYFYVGRKKEGVIHYFTLAFIFSDVLLDLRKIWHNEFTDKDGKLIVRGN